MKTIHIFGGGTVSYIRNHLALCAPAYGNTARYLQEYMHGRWADSYLHLTKMADPQHSTMETNDDVWARLQKLVNDPTTGVIIMNAALCDYNGSVCLPNEQGSGSTTIKSGKHEPRLRTIEGRQSVVLTPAAKIISGIKRSRPDIYVVGFKTTTNATDADQVRRASGLLASGCDLVLANDTTTRNNILCWNGTCVRESRDSLLSLLADTVIHAVTPDP